MPIHTRDAIRGEPFDDVHASHDLSIVLLKYKMSAHEHQPGHVYTVVHDELMLDGNSRMNLATFCQTWSEPELHELMDECLDKNMIDRARSGP